MLVNDWRNMPEPWLLWLNTGILVISSLVFHRQPNMLEKDIFDKTKNWLYLLDFLLTSFLLVNLLCGINLWLLDIMQQLM